MNNGMALSVGEVTEADIRLVVSTRDGRIILALVAVGHGADGGDAVFEADMLASEAGLSPIRCGSTRRRCARGSR